MAYGDVVQRSAASTLSRSIISGEIESYGELIMIERLRETRGRGSWLFLVRIEGRNALFSSIIVKDELPWVPLVANLEPLSGQLVILVFGAHRQAVES